MASTTRKDEYRLQGISRQIELAWELFPDDVDRVSAMGAVLIHLIAETVNGEHDEVLEALDGIREAYEEGVDNGDIDWEIPH